MFPCYSYLQSCLSKSYVRNDIMYYLMKCIQLIRTHLNGSCYGDDDYYYNYDKDEDQNENEVDAVAF